MKSAVRTFVVILISFYYLFLKDLRFYLVHNGKIPLYFLVIIFPLYILYP
jgi:hypothetical protein